MDKIYTYTPKPLCLPDGLKVSDKDLVVTGSIYQKAELLKDLYFKIAELEISNQLHNTKREIAVKATTNESLKIETYFCIVHRWTLVKIDAKNFLYVTYIVRI